MRRILIAGVGHDHLRDLSAGRVLVERLRRREWPSGVQIEDLSIGAVAFVYWLQEHPPFDAALFVTAQPRGRVPASIHCYPWDPPPRSVEEVQGHVADALMGIVAVETLLTVAGHLGSLPPCVRVIEVEPQDQEWGSQFSEAVAAALDRLEAIVRREVEELL